MNYHKTHRKKQFLAMFLTGSLMLSGIPVYAAQDTDMDLSVDTTESDDDFQFLHPTTLISPLTLMILKLLRIHLKFLIPIQILLQIFPQKIMTLCFLPEQILTLILNPTTFLVVL